ncbi:DUF4270 domain-containing protein [Flavobacterium sp. N1994]|uniref:DUF4270 domain-containing protein n=1 Tax=Flavobacterium sp. N1994 TaxID=2986827 RepID=UPI00222149EB|nr:DUF4270 domain-containing protein [Flavobacterium sp. N1994]
MYKKTFLHPLLFGLVTILFISCDKDYNEIGTNIVGDDHFGFEVDTTSTIKAYNQKLGEIASNNLPINALGFYTNPAFGTTQANFVTQVELAAINPTFNNTTPGDYSTDIGHGPTAIDSVVMEIPYFKTLKTANTDGTNIYRLDSIYGAKPYDIETPAEVSSKFKLSIFQSNYFLRDLDPDQSLIEQQLYYTGQNQDDVINNNKIPVLLNDAPLVNVTDGIQNADGHENDNFYFDKREHKTKSLASDGVTPVYTRSVPSMRLHLNKTIFANLIFNAPSGKLTDNTTFKNYFRGLYFKVENGNPGNMAMLNFKGGKITLYYNEDNKTTSSTGVVTYTRENKSFILNLTGNSISLLKNSLENTDYLNAANSSQEASEIYLKGGQGSMAYIDLFGSTDTKGYVLNSAYNSNLPISATNQKYTLTGPNGKPDEIDDIIYNGWLINEANLTFNIKKSAMSDTKTIEPNRIFLYDLTHKKALVDYTYDGTTDSSYPKNNKYIFGGILLDNNNAILKQRDATTGEITNKGTKYKIRITNYVRNLIKNDSTNVRLGLSITESINSTGISKLKTANSISAYAPTMSVLSPLGTILYGTNNPPVPGPNPGQPYKQRLKLEIYYTKPN